MPLASSVLVALAFAEGGPQHHPPTSRFFVLTNNNAGSLLFRPTNAPLPGSELSISRPAPGIYEAAPYKCIVVVPDAQLDDQCIVGPRANPPRMPTIKPDLELIPRKPK
jgi:hypothetical protein